MKVLDIIDSLPVGEVVPKRVLAVLKRTGKIKDYSPTWGYLTGREGFIDVEYKGRYFESRYFDGCFCPYLVKADRRPKKRIDMIQYKGNYKRTYSEDALVTTLWRLSYRAKDLNFNAFWEYYKRKQTACPVQNTRTTIGKVKHDFALWGAVI